MKRRKWMVDDKWKRVSFVDNLRSVWGVTMVVVVVLTSGSGGVDDRGGRLLVRWFNEEGGGSNNRKGFSAMKIFKTRLRNKMSNEYLTDSLVIYVEKEIAEKFDSNSIIDEFKDLKDPVIFSPRAENVQDPSLTVKLPDYINQERPTTDTNLNDTSNEITKFIYVDQLSTPPSPNVLPAHIHAFTTTINRPPSVITTIRHHHHHLSNHHQWTTTSTIETLHHPLRCRQTRNIHQQPHPSSLDSPVTTSATTTAPSSETSFPFSFVIELT
ncbi:hypothetical protein QVD17_14781 [Tagetes erecta]|uniref:Uncharacterized protein n=1 Tax=Tagetes erecta TaxID=13708 RepID=A0AAD8KR34_TARER|nr:hypothetical protein QVD17_14781 [Tagetes erecta]